MIKPNEIIVAISVCLLATGLSAAQNKISGRVVDAATGEPLPNANVFFANTSIGTSTNLDGQFTISGFGSGKYDFNVTFVGYQLFNQSFAFSGTEDIRLLVKLPVNTEQLKEVVVKANDRQREQNIKAFKKLFLGENKYARQCSITNMDEIYFFRDFEQGVFIVNASKPIIVENKALGYRIRYHLLFFEHYYLSGELKVYGIPQFEELQESKAGDLAMWEKNRAEAYRGSLVHFMRALKSNQLQEQLFFASRVFERPNPERPPQVVLDKQIDSLKNLRDNENSDVKRRIFAMQLQAVGNLTLLPATLDSFAIEKLRSVDLMDKETPNRVAFLGRLIIRWGPGERDKPPARRGISRASEGQNSDVRFLAKFSIFENGYYDYPGSLFVEGYWLETERVSMMVPLDYELSKK